VDDGEATVEQRWVLYYPTGVTPEAARPLTCNLEQNFPNPFNPVTTIRFTLAKPGWMQLRIYDEQGRLRRTLAEGYYSAGSQQAIWDARDDDGRPVGSGVYLCRLQGADFSFMRKLLYVK
jgi:hypothetical protein